jgi:hypothetical protein
MVGLLGRVISPSQGLCVHRTIQHKKTQTNIHALRDSNPRSQQPSGEDPRLRLHGHCDRLGVLLFKILLALKECFIFRRQIKKKLVFFIFSCATRRLFFIFLYIKCMFPQFVRRHMTRLFTVDGTIQNTWFMPVTRNSLSYTVSTRTCLRVSRRRIFFSVS